MRNEWAEKRLMSLVHLALSDDLRHKGYRGDPNPLRGHCYVASEALYHLLGRDSYIPTRARLCGETHWWLRHQDGDVLDPTAAQFSEPFFYEKGVGGGFMTRQPSRRAQVVIDRVRQMT